MTRPCIISVAITGSVPRKRDNPALPVTVPEQIESTHAAYEAGATLVHVHVRNDDRPPLIPATRGGARRSPPAAPRARRNDAGAVAAFDRLVRLGLSGT
jgi:3-keto-5-aminohexanoate cleavage enzyme